MMSDLRALPREVDGVHPPFANYSHGVIVPPGKTLLYLSGQLGITAEKAVPEGAEEQADIIFGSIRKLLAEGGMTPQHIVRINAFVTSPEYLADYMRSRDRFLQGDGPSPAAATAVPPASTLMVVAGFSRPEFKVEVEIVAARD